MSKYTRKDCDRVFEKIEKGHGTLPYELTFRFAKKLQKLSQVTNVCPECLINVEENKRNRETKISGLCTDCQKLYFHDDDVAFRNNLDSYHPCHMDGEDYWSWQSKERYEQLEIPFEEDEE